MEGLGGPATSSEDQLIAQTHRLALARIFSPAYIDPYYDLGMDEQEVATGAVAARPDHSGLPGHPRSLNDLPNEVLFQIFAFLDVSDLLAVSRVSVSSTWLPTNG